jgi:hypothetical protein
MEPEYMVNISVIWRYQFRAYVKCQSCPFELKTLEIRSQNLYTGHTLHPRNNGWNSAERAPRGSGARERSA